MHAQGQHGHTGAVGGTPPSTNPFFCENPKNAFFGFWHEKTRFLPENLFFLEVAGGTPPYCADLLDLVHIPTIPSADEPTVVSP